MATLEVSPSPTLKNPAEALGAAFGALASQCALEAQERLRQYRWVGRPASARFIASREAALLISNLLIARWLITGESINKDEAAWLQIRGTLAAAEQLSVVNVTRSYLCWRDVAIETLTRLAADLETPAAVLEQALTSVRVSSDASIMRMARAYDAETERLRDQLASEREAFRHQALHDPLTGVPNRVLLYDRVQQAINAARRRGGRVALLLVDLNRFKDVNDRLGHDAGDEVLRKLAIALVAARRSSDTVARLGGDEFAIVLPDCANVESGLRTAQQMVATLAEPLSVAGAEVVVGGSVGVALFPDHGDSVEALLAAADAAMYRAKRGAPTDFELAGRVAAAS